MITLKGLSFWLKFDISVINNHNRCVLKIDYLFKHIQLHKVVSFFSATKDLANRYMDLLYSEVYYMGYISYTLFLLFFLKQTQIENWGLSAPRGF